MLKVHDQGSGSKFQQNALIEDSNLSPKLKTQAKASSSTLMVQN